MHKNRLGLRTFSQNLHHLKVFERRKAAVFVLYIIRFSFLTFGTRCIASLAFALQVRHFF